LAGTTTTRNPRLTVGLYLILRFGIALYGRAQPSRYR
jgi:hypothetical protein